MFISAGKYNSLGNPEHPPKKINRLSPLVQSIIITDQQVIISVRQHLQMTEDWIEENGKIIVNEKCVVVVVVVVVIVVAVVVVVVMVVAVVVVAVVVKDNFEAEIGKSDFVLRSNLMLNFCVTKWNKFFGWTGQGKRDQQCKPLFAAIADVCAWSS